MMSTMSLAAAPRRDAGLGNLARLFLVAVFAFSAIHKALHFDAAAAEMQALGLPMPALTAALVILVQAAGSILLLIPRTAFAGAALLAGFTVVATVIAHGFWRASDQAFVRELTIFLEHLGIVGGLILAGQPSSRPAAGG